MNAAIQQIEREVHDLKAQIDARGFATRQDRKLLRAMRDRLVLARRGVTA